MKNCLAGTAALVALFLPIQVAGQSGTSIKSGWSLSAFRGRDCSLKPGVVMAVEKEWGLGGRTSLALEVSYATRGGVFKDKVCGWSCCGYKLTRESQICSVGFLDLPLLFRYQFKRSPQWRWQLALGLALSVAVNDNSETLRREWIPDSYDPATGRATKPIDFPWYEGDGPLPQVIDNSTLSGHLGVGLKWSNYHAEVRYVLPFSGLNHAIGISLQEKQYHALGITLGVWLPRKQKCHQDEARN